MEYIYIYIYIYIHIYHKSHSSRVLKVMLRVYVINSRSLILTSGGGLAFPELRFLSPHVSTWLWEVSWFVLASIVKSQLKALRRLLKLLCSFSGCLFVVCQVLYNELLPGDGCSTSVLSSISPRRSC